MLRERQRDHVAAGLDEHPLDHLTAGRVQRDPQLRTTRRAGCPATGVSSSTPPRSTRTRASRRSASPSSAANNASRCACNHPLAALSGAGPPRGSLASFAAIVSAPAASVVVAPSASSSRSSSRPPASVVKLSSPWTTRGSYSSADTRVIR